MKKIILTLLLTLNVFAMSETPTNQNEDSKCLTRSFYENQSEIDQMIAQEKQSGKVEGSKSIRR